MKRCGFVGPVPRLVPTTLPARCDRRPVFLVAGEALVCQSHVVEVLRDLTAGGAVSVERSR